MGYRTKQRILNRGNSNGRKTFKELLNIPNHQGNANQKTLRYHLIPVRMTKIKNTEDTLCWRGCGARGTLLHCWWECKLVQPLWKSIWRFLRKLGIHLPQDPAIPLLGIYPRNAQPHHKSTCSAMFISALFVIARTWKQPRCPSTEEWINKMWYIYTMEYYSAEKNNDMIRFADLTREATWKTGTQERHGDHPMTEKWNEIYMNSLDMSGDSEGRGSRERELGGMGDPSRINNREGEQGIGDHGKGRPHENRKKQSAREAHRNPQRYPHNRLLAVVEIQPELTYSGDGMTKHPNCHARNLIQLLRDLDAEIHG
ncbi:uncharacterized protein LOC128096006 [Peromyscus californicus insignis]|uniref:uncharacterized protein LOC128096006 n=1 Tax=Peromyscus californicus insignis TaxID=564181 RepID=UPI0022A7FD2B|nr:uncharacterized protein LOC128096006 [Peromyscus californicus insignis]